MADTADVKLFSNTTRRVIATAAMVAIAGVAALLQWLGVPAVQILSVLVATGMIVELVICLRNTPRDIMWRHALSFLIFAALLVLLVFAAYHVGARPWVILRLLLIIGAADIGAWFFGRAFGGDKMWERISANKTWSGQIAGIACGAVVAILYGMAVRGTFAASASQVWVGISIALLSQYGDLTASWIKRNMGIKDFGRIIPGHGGLLDRFDGWIYVLPLVWLVML